MIFNNKILNILFTFITILDFFVSSIDLDAPLETELIYSHYYFRKLSRFNQNKMDPSDFFLSIHSPHNIRIPSPKMSYSSYQKMINSLSDEYVHFGRDILSAASLKTTDNDLKWNIFGNEFYLNTSPEFSEIHMKFVELESIKRKFLAYQVLDKNANEEPMTLYDERILRALKNEQIKSKRDEEILQKLENYKIDAEKLETEKLKPLDLKKFNIVKNLMNFLPKVNDTPEIFNQDHFEILKFMLYINPKIREQIKSENSYNTENIRPERIHFLKSSFFLTNEKYYYYIIRMKHNGFIPLHYAIYKKENGNQTTNDEEKSTDGLEVLFNCNKIINVSIIFMIAALNTVHSYRDIQLPALYVEKDENDYETYFKRQFTRFNQEKLYPTEFFMSLFNPYYLRIPKPGMSYDDYLKFFEKLMREYYSFSTFLTNEANGNSSPSYNDTKWMVPFSPHIYVTPAIEYFDLNLRYYKLQSMKKGLKMLGVQVEDHDVKVAGIYKQYHEEHTKENFQENDLSKPPKKTLNKLSAQEFDAILQLMNVLPEPGKSDEYYKNKFEELKNLMAQIGTIINKDKTVLDIAKVDLEILKKMTKKSLMKIETYEFYVIRMVHLGVVPLDLDVCQREFGEFTDDILSDNSNLNSLYQQ